MKTCKEDRKMKTLTVLWVVFCLAACGGNLITDNIGILTSGLSVESSDGKYIGDIIGMEAPEGLSSVVCEAKSETKKWFPRV